ANNMKLLEERLKRYKDEAGLISSTSKLIDRVSYLRENREMMRQRPSLILKIQ
ncbi:27352_t:CDS:1, partial [Racocetra persica]